RWQWLSTSMSDYLCRRRLDVTGEDCLWCRQRCTRRYARLAAEGCEHPRPAMGNAEAVEQLFGSRWHHRLRQDSDLADHLRGDVEHRVLARRIGLGQRPGRLASE